MRTQETKASAGYADAGETKMPGAFEHDSREPSKTGGRFLVVAKGIPYPPGDGAAIRTWGLVRALAANGHTVDLVCFGQPEDAELARHAVLDVCASVAVLPSPTTPLSGANVHWRRVRGLGSAIPYSVGRFSSPAMQTLIKERLRTSAFDAIFCDNPYLFVNLPVPTAVPVILNSHNVENLLLRRYVQVERNPLKRAYGLLEWRKMERWERLVASRSALVMVCSEHDRSVMAQMCPGTPLEVVPNVIDVEKHDPIGAEDGQTILYTGAMDWYPNQDAVSHFVSRIWPEVRRLAPDATFRVAGRGASGELRQRFLGVSGVQFEGTVPDMRAELARAAVCVVPLRIASGTRLKILEAAALTKAIVSTRVGAEGLDFVDGKEILLADAPRTFARAVAELVADLGRRRSLGLAARQRVEAQYGFPHLREAVGRALASFNRGRR
jgi:polysaccharide biosynthesis protein PslH